MFRHISTLQRLLTALLFLVLVACDSALSQSPPPAGSSPTASAPAATALAVTTTAAPQPPTAMPATAAPPHTTAPVPAAPTTALPATKPTAPATPIALLSLPTPSPSARNEPLPPPAWLIVGDTAVLASLGGFQYTIDLGGGNLNPATRDAGLPDASSNVARVSLPPTARAVLVIGAAGIKQVRARVQPWPPDPTGNSANERELAVSGHREGEAMVYVLEPSGAAGEQFLNVSVSFTGGIHEGDYADYYWRLSPAAAASQATESETVSNPPPAPGGILPAALYYLGGGQEAQSQIFRLERDGKTITKITDEKPASPGILAVLEFDVSPADGSLAYIVQGAAGNMLVQADKDGKHRRVLLSGASVSNPLWSPDGKQIAVQIYRAPDAKAGLAGGTYLIPAGGGEPKLLQANDVVKDPANPDPKAMGYNPVAWSPDGTRLLLNACSQSIDLCGAVVKNLASGKLVPLRALERMTTVSSGGWSADGKAIYVTMYQPGSMAPILGLWRADPATGELTSYIPASPVEGKFTLVAGVHPGRDGSISALLATTDKLPEVGGDNVVWPKFGLYRVSADGKQTQQLGAPNNENPGDVVLWAKDDSGVVIDAHMVDANNVSTAMLWLPSDGGPAVTIPVSSSVLHWGVD
jgi:WD40-like Beta Propeller Repeat